MFTVLQTCVILSAHQRIHRIFRQGKVQPAGNDFHRGSFTLRAHRYSRMPVSGSLSRQHPKPLQCGHLSPLRHLRLLSVFPSISSIPHFHRYNPDLTHRPLLQVPLPKRVHCHFLCPFSSRVLVDSGVSVASGVLVNSGVSVTSGISVFASSVAKTPVLIVTNRSTVINSASARRSLFLFLIMKFS